ncbi:MAG: sulfatase activating formylglycine-generating enzyme [Verrucomicrobiales bacterium]|jgi:formylglycine-generating enzyme required for sulfatase activity
MVPDCFPKAQPEFEIDRFMKFHLIQFLRIVAHRILPVLVLSIMSLSQATGDTFSATMEAKRLPRTLPPEWAGLEFSITTVFVLLNELPAPTSSLVDADTARWEWVDVETTLEGIEDLFKLALEINDEEQMFSEPIAGLSLTLNGGPESPVDVKALANGATSVVVSWRYPHASGYHFDVYRSNTANFDEAEKVGDGGNASPYADTTPEAADGYHYWVVAIRESDSAASFRGTIAPVIPIPDEDVPEIQSFGIQRVNDFFGLSWHDAGNEYKYLLYQDGEEIAEVWDSIVSFSGHDDFFNLPLEGGRAYQFSVAAVRISDGEIGPRSAVIKVGFEDDEEAPEITGVSGNITQQANHGAGNTVVTWNAPSATDNVGVETFESTHKPGDSFPVGVTTVTYTARDAAGNETTASFLVTIIAANTTSDVVFASLGKVRLFEQHTHHGGPTVAASSWAFEAIALAKNDSVRLNSVTVKPQSPQGEALELFQVERRIDTEQGYATQAELDAAFPDGEYTFTFDTPNQGGITMAFTLNAEGALPLSSRGPRVTNLIAAQTIDASTDFALRWKLPADTTDIDAIRVLIRSPDGRDLLNQTLPATTTSLAIPAGTLDSGFDHYAEISLVRRTLAQAGFENAAYPGVAVEAYFATKTTFSLSAKASLNYNAYRSLFYSNPDSQAWNSNTDGDDYNLLEEYQYGLDPTKADQPQSPVYLRQNGRFYYSVPRIAGIGIGITPLQGSVNLLDWEPVDGIVSQGALDLTGTLPRGWVDLEIPTANHSEYFVRQTPLSFDEITPSITAVRGSKHTVGDKIVLELQNFDQTTENLTIWFGDTEMPVVEFDRTAGTVSTVIPPILNSVALSIDVGFGPRESGLTIQASAITLPPGMTSAHVESRFDVAFSNLALKIRKDANASESADPTLIAWGEALADILSEATASVATSLKQLDPADRDAINALLLRSGFLDELESIEFADAQAREPRDGEEAPSTWDTIRSNRQHLKLVKQFSTVADGVSLITIALGISPDPFTKAGLPFTIALELAPAVYESYIAHKKPIILTQLKAQVEAEHIYRGEEYPVTFHGDFEAIAGGSFTVDAVLQSAITLVAAKITRVVEKLWKAGKLANFSSLQQVKRSVEITLEKVKAWVRSIYKKWDLFDKSVNVPTANDVMIYVGGGHVPFNINWIDEEGLCVYFSNSSEIIPTMTGLIKGQIRVEDTEILSLFEEDQKPLIQSFAVTTLEAMAENRPPHIAQAPTLAVSDSPIVSGKLILEDDDRWACSSPSHDTGNDVIALTLVEKTKPKYGVVMIDQGSVIDSDILKDKDQKEFVITYELNEQLPNPDVINAQDVTVFYESPTDPSSIQNVPVPLEANAPELLKDTFTLSFSDSFDTKEVEIEVALPECEIEFQLHPDDLESVPGILQSLVGDNIVAIASSFWFYPDPNEEHLEPIEIRYRAKCKGENGAQSDWATITFSPTYDATGFVEIPGGEFVFGGPDTYTNGRNAHSEPVTIMMTPYSIGRTEVTKAEWDDVRTWGLEHGYSDLPEGGGIGPYHPVVAVNWHDAVKWCNALSEKKARPPCYTVDDQIYRSDVGRPDTNYSSNGYRLPTEAEWEKAARGGLEQKLFPWGDTISHEHANYYAYGWGVSLISVAKIEDLTERDRSRIVVARVGDKLHLRVFDFSGAMIFDEVEDNMAASGEDLMVLKELINSETFPDNSRLTANERYRLSSTVSDIVRSETGRSLWPVQGTFRPPLAWVLEVERSPDLGFHPAWNFGTSPVGSFAPNAYGVYDVTGNAREWCNDFVANAGFSRFLVYWDIVDPTGWEYEKILDDGTVLDWTERGGVRLPRSSRGGGWASNPAIVFHRHALEPFSRSIDQGFRLVVRGEP